MRHADHRRQLHFRQFALGSAQQWGHRRCGLAEQCQRHDEGHPVYDPRQMVTRTSTPPTLAQSAPENEEQGLGAARCADWSAVVLSSEDRTPQYYAVGRYLNKTDNS